MHFWGMLNVRSDLAVNLSLWLMQFFIRLPLLHFPRGQLGKDTRHSLDLPQKKI